MIDPAMLRPGRLDKLLYVELPTPEERYEILKKLTKRTPLAPDMDLELIANNHQCKGFRCVIMPSLLLLVLVASFLYSVIQKYQVLFFFFFLTEFSNNFLPDSSHSGADLAALVRESAVAALRSTLYVHGTTLSAADADAHATDANAIFVTKEHFDMAFEKVAPSVSKQVCWVG